MADITDPNVVRFVKEVIRPVAEAIRSSDADSTDAIDSYFLGISDVVGAAAGTDVIVDGMEAGGVAPLTAADVVNFITLLQALTAELDTPAKRNVMLKPVVRALRRGR